MGGGPPRFPQGFSCPVVLRVPSRSAKTFRLRGSHPLWLAFPDHFDYQHPFLTPCETSYNPREYKLCWFGLFPVRSPLLRESLFAFFSSGYLDVSVPPVASNHPMYSGRSTSPLRLGGFPHSEISGSKLTYSSPKHIGVRPVLRRLLAPRHPPYALRSLT